MSNSTERYNDYIEQLAREDIREAENKYQENVAELEEAKRQVWNEALEAAADIAQEYADTDYCAMGYPEDGGIAASGTAQTIAAAIRAIKKEKP
jgi:hypothetical protein